MKIIILVLISFPAIILSVSAQSAEDYRSIASGNWNDVTKWQTYNGSTWVSASSYPGQNSNAGAVTISTGTQITLTASVPNSIPALNINTDFDQVQTPGSLLFSSANAVSLTVSGSVIVYGNMSITDQSGAKVHSLTIGGSLVAGKWTYDLEFEWCDYECLYSYCYYPIGGYIQSSTNDDALKVIFNTTKPGSSIGGAREITFQDISFDGIGISVETPIYINGTARFVNGIVNAFDGPCNNSCGYISFPSDSAPPAPSTCGIMFFNDGAVALNASVNSFVNGSVWKQGNDPFTFPLGYGVVYAPLSISAPVAAQDVFRASYSRAQLYRDINDTGLHSVSNCEYWYLSPGYPSHNENLTSSIDVTAGWSSTSGCGSFNYITNVPDVKLAHANNYSWDSHGGSGEGTTTSGSVTWRGVSDFGAFALGNVNASCATPSALSATNITTNSATLSWSAVPGSVSYDVSYKPTTFCCWTNVATATPSTSINLTGLNYSTTYVWKVSTVCSWSSSSLCRLATPFTTSSPCGTPSGLTSTNITSSSTTVSWSAVANAVNYSVQFKQSASPSWIPIASVNTLSYNLGGLLPATAYDWRVLANCNAGPGNYAQASFTTVCNDTYEPNNTSNSAKTIALGTTISATISSATDVDWFIVALPNASTNLQVTLSNLSADYDLYVYNKSLSLVASSTGTGTGNETVTYGSHARNAAYYIKVVGKNGAYTAIQCYNLSAQAIPGAVTTAIANTGNEIISSSQNVSFYPNPASDLINMQLNSVSNGASEVQILNNVGQVVKSYHLNIVKGNNLIRIPLYDITPGVYILKINNSEFSSANKFVIAR